jgi:Protein of unknown function (DUF3551)
MLRVLVASLTIAASGALDAAMAQLCIKGCDFGAGYCGFDSYAHCQAAAAGRDGGFRKQGYHFGPERGSSDPRVRGDHLHRCGTVQASGLRLSSKHGADRPVLFTDRASCASVVMVRYALHASRNEISGGKMADVTQADHADHPPALVDSGTP